MRSLLLFWSTAALKQLYSCQDWKPLHWWQDNNGRNGVSEETIFKSLLQAVLSSLAVGVCSISCHSPCLSPSHLLSIKFSFHVHYVLSLLFFLLLLSFDAHQAVLIWPSSILSVQFRSSFLCFYKFLLLASWNWSVQWVWNHWSTLNFYHRVLKLLYTTVF